MSPEIVALLSRIPFLVILGAGFCFMLLLTGFIGFVVIDVIRTSGTKLPDSWATLAKNNGLTFKPGNFSVLGKGAHIIGDYGNYQLKLEVIDAPSLSLMQTYTNTRLTISQTSQDQVNVQDIATPTDAEAIINFLAPNGLPYEWKGAIRAKPFGREIYYEDYGVERDTEYLQTLFDLLSDIANAYPHVIRWGGQIVPALELIVARKNQLRLIALDLIRDIGRETTKQVGGRASNLLCPDCLMHFTAHKVNMTWRTITYYGCRRCKQSNEFIEMEGPVVAVLDYKTSMQQIRQNGQLRVNWFSYNEPFDFDKVEIIWATDEDIERFAVKLGNDDPMRRPRYKQMECIVSSGCSVSENGMRILRKTFGQLKKKKIEVEQS